MRESQPQLRSAALSSSTSFRPPAHTVERQLKTTSNARRTQFAAFSAVRSSLYCVCLIIPAVDLRNDSGNSTPRTNFELESGDPCRLQVQKLWEAQRRSPAAPGCVSRSGSASRCIPRLSSPFYSICCNCSTLFSIPNPTHERVGPYGTVEFERVANVARVTPLVMPGAR